MKRITEQYTETVHKESWAKAIAEYGSAYKVPTDVVQDINEIGRGLYVIQTWQDKGSNGSPIAFLASYSITSDVAERIMREHLGEQKNDKPTTISTKAKIEKLMSNATNNYGKTFTTEQLSNISGLSPQTVVKHLKIVRHYRRVKRGLYEAQNPKTI